MYSLTSPGYPVPYPIDTDCTWTIYSEMEEELLMKIHFIELHTQIGMDFLRIQNTNGTVLSLSGYIAPSSVLMNTTEIAVTFTSYIFNNYHKGFALELSLSHVNGKKSV